MSREIPGIPPLTRKLKVTLWAAEKAHSTRNRFFYSGCVPEIFRSCSEAGGGQSRDSLKRRMAKWARVIVEKPPSEEIWIREELNRELKENSG